MIGVLSLDSGVDGSAGSGSRVAIRPEWHMLPCGYCNAAFKPCWTCTQVREISVLSGTIDQ